MRLTDRSSYAGADDALAADHVAVHRPQVRIIVPCYNEAKRLPVAEFDRIVSDERLQFIFVDDGSRDNTQEILTELLSGREDRAVVLKCAENRGKAEAVRYGMSYALDQDTDYAGFWDADLATPLNAIQEFVAILDARPEIDMVFGSRVKLLGRCVDRRPTRHYVGRIFATVVSSLLRLPIYDTQCGAKIFRRSPRIRDLFRQPFLSRWVFDVELIARYIVQTGSPEAAAQGIYEYPLHSWADIKGSKLKASDFIVAFWDVVRVYWKYMR